MTLRQLIQKTEGFLSSDSGSLAGKDLPKLYELERKVVEHIATLENSKSESRTKSILAWEEFLGVVEERNE